MSLARLLLQLKPLLDDPDGNLAAILQVLGAHQELAEYEVARHLVGQVFARRLDDMVTSEDPSSGVRPWDSSCGSARRA